MLYGITDLERQELQKNFNFFLKNAYKSENFDDVVNDLRKMIDNDEVLHYDFADFNKIIENGKEYYTCSLLNDNILFEDEGSGYLVWQRQKAEDDFYGYIAYRLKNDKYWLLLFGERILARQC